MSKKHFKMSSVEMCFACTHCPYLSGGFRMRCGRPLYSDQEMVKP